MRKGEKAILRCRADYAYGDRDQPKIPGGSTLNFDVELISFGPKKKELWEYSDAEKEAEGLKLKEKGAYKAACNFDISAITSDKVLFCLFWIIQEYDIVWIIFNTFSSLR